MTNDLSKLSAQREDVLNQLKSIDRLRRGTLSRQVFTINKGKAASTQGPYFVLQAFHKGKKSSRRIPADQVPQIQQDVTNYRRFQDLADQCISLTDQMTQLAEGLPACKKNSARVKSSKNSSGKPMPS